MNIRIPKHNKIIFSLIFLGVFVFSTGIVSASQITEMSVLELVNQARIDKGLKPLETNEKLFKIASDKADDMIGNDYFSHTSPEGTTPWFWFEKEKYDYKFAGENLAINFSSAEEQQKAWMESETHRKNILDPNYREIGIAVKKGVIDGKLTTIVVQEFGLRTNYIEANPSKKGEVLASNFPPKIEMSSVQNFNEKLLEAGKKITNPVSESSQLSMYLRKGAVAVAWAVIIVNSALILWLIFSSRVFKRKGKGELPASFNLYTLSQEEYADFLKKFSVNSEDVKTVYLKQAKAKR